MHQPHRLMRETEDHFMVTHNAPDTQGCHTIPFQIQCLRNFSCRARYLRFFPEVLLHICKRRNALQQFGSQNQKVNASVMLGEHMTRVLFPSERS